MNVFDAPSFDGHEDVSFACDESTGLRAIIAVHNSHRGPALGGCRMFPYASTDDALHDVLRLSRGMTLKSALAGLPYGGGKAVIIGDPLKDKTEPLLQAMGRVIQRMEGRYITAEDSGTCVADMKVIASRTHYVAGIDERAPYGGDPSPYTAYGVFCGIASSLQYRFGSCDLRRRHVVIQGAGAVGMQLLRLLLEAGAKISISDINEALLQAAAALGAAIVDPDAVLQMDADVLSPCAMGGIITADSANSINAPIIAGSANNQLLSGAAGRVLHDRGILYSPDFAVNAGGIIAIHYQRIGGSDAQCRRHIRRSANVLETIFRRAAREGKPTQTIAETLAEAHLTAPLSASAIRA